MRKKGRFASTSNIKSDWWPNSPKMEDNWLKLDNLPDLDVSYYSCHKSSIFGAQTALRIWYANYFGVKGVVIRNPINSGVRFLVETTHHPECTLWLSIVPFWLKWQISPENVLLSANLGICEYLQLSFRLPEWLWKHSYPSASGSVLCSSYSL